MFTKLFHLIIGQSPLHIACKKGDAREVSRLIAVGENIHSRNRNGMSPVDVSIDADRADCLALLIKAGAGIQTEDEIASPIHAASEAENPDCLRLLLEHGINPSAPYHGIGLTAAHIACTYNRPTNLKCLLDAGADCNAKELEGYVPAHYAAEDGNSECLSLLISAGADINAVNEDGDTPMHLAAFMGRTDCVQLLIAAGADTTRKNNGGLTPADVARNEKHEACIRILTGITR